MGSSGRRNSLSAMAFTPVGWLNMDVDVHHTVARGQQRVLYAMGNPVAFPDRYVAVDLHMNIDPKTESALTNAAHIDPGHTLDALSDFADVLNNAFRQRRIVDLAPRLSQKLDTIERDHARGKECRPIVGLLVTLAAYKRDGYS